MSEIPEDVLKTAERCMREVGTVHAVAHAILAERERAATFCEQYMMGTGYRDTRAQYSNYVATEAPPGATHQGMGYADAIRKGVHTASMEAAATGYLSRRRAIKEGE